MMKQPTLFSLLVALLLAMGAAQAPAAIIPWTAVMTPDQEPHEVVGLFGTEIGSASGTVNTDSLELTWAVQWSNLTGPAVGLHFHLGAPGVPGPITVDIFTGEPHGATDQVTGSSTISATGLAELLAGDWYLNVHTALNPGGEIRGQVVPGQPRAVPTPAPLGLLLIAGALVGLWRRLL
jgi:hypothetical protein